MNSPGKKEQTKYVCMWQVCCEGGNLIIFLYLDYPLSLSWSSQTPCYGLAWADKDPGYRWVRMGVVAFYSFWFLANNTLSLEHKYRHSLLYLAHATDTSVLAEVSNQTSHLSNISYPDYLRRAATEVQSLLQNQEPGLCNASNLCWPGEVWNRDWNHVPCVVAWRVTSYYWSTETIWSESLMKNCFSVTE